MRSDDIIPPAPFAFVLPRYGNEALRDKISDFRELVANVEYRTVLEGVRKVDVYHLHGNNYDKKIDKILDDGLFFKSISRVKAYNGYSHSHTLSDDLDDSVMIYGVVARDKESADLFKKYHTGKIDHREIGLLLGYPECCAKKFTEYWDISGDPIFEIAGNSNACKRSENRIKLRDYDHRLNVALRYFGIRIIPYFPCSFNCEPSGDIASTWSDIMMSENKSTTKEILELLDAPFEWSLLNAQIRIMHPEFQGHASGYYDDQYKQVKF